MSRQQPVTVMQVRRVCHANASELRLPLLVDGIYVGLLHLGPYRLRKDQPAELPLIRPEQESWLETMLMGLRDHLCLMLRQVRTEVSGLENLLLSRIERYLAENLSEGVNRDQLARFLGKSPHWVSRYIQDNTGQTFREIKDKCRLAMARQLLLNSDLPVEAIAAETGMELSYFYRFFQARMLITPAAYRKKFRPSPEMI